MRRTLRRDYREEDLTEAGLRIYTSLDPRAQDQAEQALEKELERLDQVRASTKIRQDDASAARRRGGRHGAAERRSDRDRRRPATWATTGSIARWMRARPMGSLVKPFIYLTALETGRYNAASDRAGRARRVSSCRTASALAAGEFHPGRSTGRCRVVRALAESLNLATVGLGMRCRVAEGRRRRCSGLGCRARRRKCRRCCSARVDVTPLEAAQIYNGLANGGFRTPLRAVRAVISEDGKPIKAFPLEVTPVATPERSISSIA